MAKQTKDPVAIAAAAQGKKMRKEATHSRPPREIRENTKARRAWIAAEIARLEAENVAGELPTVAAKSVGSGSYQEVSVTRYLYDDAGEMRYRGVCQYCGAQQVVQGPANDPHFAGEPAKVAAEMVLHGYQRPGWGFIVNRCPAVGMRPLNFDKSGTEGFLADDRAKLPRLVARAAELATVEADGKRAANGGDIAPTALHTPIYRANGEYPEKPTRWNKKTDGQYADEVVAWQQRYPLVHAFNLAREAASEAAAEVTACEDRIEHFERLLSSKVYGSPLQPEVVR